jgi:alpha-beta hydrolase superfamily lysophospholipase
MGNNWILIRGLTRGIGHWGDFPELMEGRGANVELLEIPGNGNLHNLATPTRPQECLAYFKSNSRLWRGTEPINICGISLGGMLALKWAESDPSRIVSVAVINSSLSQFSPAFRRLRPQNYGAIVQTLLRKPTLARERLILQMVSNRPDRIKKFENQFAEFSSLNPVSKINLLRQLVLASNISINDRFSVPIKILVSKMDRLVDKSCSYKIAKAFSTELHEHPTAGHDLALDTPEWLCQQLLAGE